MSFSKTESVSLYPLGRKHVSTAPTINEPITFGQLHLLLLLPQY